MLSWSLGICSFLLKSMGQWKGSFRLFYLGSLSLVLCLPLGVFGSGRLNKSCRQANYETAVLELEDATRRKNSLGYAGDHRHLPFLGCFCCLGRAILRWNRHATMNMLQEGMVLYTCYHLEQVTCHEFSSLSELPGTCPGLFSMEGRGHLFCRKELEGRNTLEPVKVWEEACGVLLLLLGWAFSLGAPVLLPGWACTDTTAGRKDTALAISILGRVWCVWRRRGDGVQSRR